MIRLTTTLASALALGASFAGCGNGGGMSGTISLPRHRHPPGRPGPAIGDPTFCAAQ